MNCTFDPDNLAPFGCGLELPGSYSCENEDAQTNCTCSPGYAPDTVGLLNHDCRLHLTSAYVLFSIPVVISCINLALMVPQLRRSRGVVRKLLLITGGQQTALVSAVVSLLASPGLQTSVAFLSFLILHNLLLSVGMELGVEAQLNALRSLLRQRPPSKLWAGSRITLRLFMDCAFLGTAAWLLANSPGGPLTLTIEQSHLYNAMYATSALSQEMYFIVLVAVVRNGALVPLRRQINEIHGNAPGRGSGATESSGAGAHTSMSTSAIQFQYYISRLDLVIRTTPIFMANLWFMFLVALVFLILFKTLPYSWIMIVSFVFIMFAMVGVLARLSLKTAPAWMFSDAGGGKVATSTASSPRPPSRASRESTQPSTSAVAAVSTVLSVDE